MLPQYAFVNVQLYQQLEHANILPVLNLSLIADFSVSHIPAELMSPIPLLELFSSIVSSVIIYV